MYIFSSYSPDYHFYILMIFCCETNGLSLLDRHIAEPRYGQPTESPLIWPSVNIRAEHSFGVFRNN